MDSNVHLDRPWKADHLSILKHISGQKVHKFILPFLPPHMMCSLTVQLVETFILLQSSMLPRFILINTTGMVTMKLRLVYLIKQWAREEGHSKEKALVFLHRGKEAAPAVSTVQEVPPILLNFTMRNQLQIIEITWTPLVYLPTWVAACQLGVKILQGMWEAGLDLIWSPTQGELIY